MLLISGCDSSDPDEGLTGPATVSGFVLDSQTGAAVADASVTFSRGSASRTEITDAQGAYTFENMATGILNMLIQADGYLDVFIEGIEIVDGENDLPPVIAPPPPAEGTYRIVLSWGEQPSDLDSHLTGPRADGSRFHVYYADRNPVSYASLDRDDVTSFGPETITLTPEVDGTYRYSVHNFSNQSATGSQGIAGEIDNSVRARVQVYSSTGLLATFLGPTPSTPGNTWRVFEMVASGGSATINPINQYVTASSAGDMSAFRPVPKQVSEISVDAAP